MLELVYADLRRLAERKMRSERPDYTLQATALVHEAYMQIAGQAIGWQNRSHCFAIAAKTMRRILVDYARSVRAGKRGGRKLSLDDVLVIGDSESDELIDIDRRLEN